MLGDGLALAAEAKPDAIVDVATLTGACIVALGDRTAGVMSNNEQLRGQVVDAAEAAGELVWPLPIPEEMTEKVKSSKLADLRQHNPKAAGGALFAAEFLHAFVGDVPWAHLDIAGPAFNEEGPYGYVPCRRNRLRRPHAGPAGARPRRASAGPGRGRRPRRRPTGRGRRRCGPDAPSRGPTRTSACRSAPVASAGGVGNAAAVANAWMASRSRAERPGTAVRTEPPTPACWRTA